MDFIRQKKLKVKITKYLFLTIGIIAIIAICLGLGQENYLLKTIEDKSVNNLKKFNKKEREHKLSINMSVFEGLTKDFLSYKILARQIDKIDKDSYRLNIIDAKYLLEDGNVNINALSGIFNSKENRVVLQNDVKITYNDLEFNTTKLNVVIDKKEGYTDENVVVNYKNSEIISDQFNTENLAKIINFSGNVKMKIDLSDFD